MIRVLLARRCSTPAYRSADRVAVRRVRPALLSLLTTAAIGVLSGTTAYAHTPSALTRADAPPPMQEASAPVFIVSSRDTFQGIRQFARDARYDRDSNGTPLVVAEVQASELPAISGEIHAREHRCGGYFAFNTRAEAEAFVRNDRSAHTINNLIAVSYSIDNQATVNPWLSAVGESGIRSTITHLSSYKNRYYTSAYGKQAAEWIQSTWSGLAGTRSDVTTELFTGCTNCSTQPSVILTIRGTELPNEVMVLGAHLDSVNNSAGTNVEMVAPGADDDASGVATLTEILRIALSSNWKPKRTVKFMAYAAEEVGLRGSNAIAQSFKTANVNVVGMLQLDMTNYKSGNPEDMQLVTDFSNEQMKTFLTQLFDEYLAPLGLTRGGITCGYGCSDHASWTSAGFPSAMMFEAGDETGANTNAFRGYFPGIHSANDTLAQMGNTAQNSTKFAKLGLAFLGELGKTGSATPPGNVAPVAGFSSSFNALSGTFTDTSSDSDGTIVSRSWTFGDGTTSTATNPAKTYAAAGTYSVGLTVTDNGGLSNTKTQSITVVAAPGSTVLSNGVPVTGLSAAKDAELTYTLVVPAGATNLRFETSGGTGDADMYVKFGAAPTTSVYDCRPYKSGNAEDCSFATPSAGTYYVKLRAYAAFSGLSLKGSFTPPGTGGTQTYSNAADVAINDNTTVDSPITVSGRSGMAPSNASVTVAIVHTYIGELKVDLVAPDGTLYNIHNRSGSGTDNINKTVTLNLSSESLNGVWKLRVNDNGVGDSGKIDSWSITF